MRYFDITLPLSHATPAWPGDVQFCHEEQRGTAITAKLTMSSHTGTHIDAPKHFLFDKSGVDAIALAKLIGPACVLPIAVKHLITKKDLQKFAIKKGERILFKTRNSLLLKRKKFTADYVSLALDAAQLLVRKRINLVATDYFGIEAKSAPDHPVHKILLAAGIAIVEGVDLSTIKAGSYMLAALPLKIKNGDGAPARVVLWK